MPRKRTNAQRSTGGTSCYMLPSQVHPRQLGLPYLWAGEPWCQRDTKTPCPASGRKPAALTARCGACSNSKQKDARGESGGSPNLNMFQQDTVMLACSCAPHQCTKRVVPCPASTPTCSHTQSCYMFLQGRLESRCSPVHLCREHMHSAAALWVCAATRPAANACMQDVWPQMSAGGIPNREVPALSRPLFARSAGWSAAGGAAGSAQLHWLPTSAHCCLPQPPPQSQPWPGQPLMRG